MKKAFSLVEVLIVVVILGILAAIIVPQFFTHESDSKNQTSKDVGSVDQPGLVEEVLTPESTE